MSYYSDLAVAEKEKIHNDRSYPSPESQLLWQLEDLIQDYLAMGGTLSDVKHSLNSPLQQASNSDNELLYSANSSYSPSLIMKCIKIALGKLSRYERDDTDEAKIIRTYIDNLLPHNRDAHSSNGKAA